MCGILFSLSDSKQILCEDLVSLNSNRGPDSQELFALNLSPLFISSFSSVLSLRGTLTPQPIQTSELVIWYNGEIYSDSNGSFPPAESTANDGETLAEQLHEMLSLMTSSVTREQTILHKLAEIEGEWAIVVLDLKSNRLYFGRDVLGRRSLVWNHNGDLSLPLTIASTGDISMFEVPADGLRMIDLNNISCGVRHFPWPEIGLDLSFKELCKELPPAAHLDEECCFYESEHFLAAQSRFADILKESVRERVSGIPPNPAGPRLGILFSGGLDCTALAILSHLSLHASEPVDLVTVAFENPRLVKSNVKCSNPFDLCPDRATARQAFEEIQRVYPDRPWRLVEVDVPFRDTLDFSERISSLAHPSNTVMDMSIAMAFWFAARSEGTLVSSKETISGYKSTARVLLSGLGADEQLGGYGRHQVAYQKSSWRGLVDELQLDVDRISSRNLGRDDRIIGDHSKEVRYPFLSTQVVSYLSHLPIHFKIDPRKPKGTGDKIILRRMVASFGLQKTSREPKRAIQFGARTAKMIDGKQKGTDVLVVNT